MRWSTRTQDASSALSASPALVGGATALLGLISVLFPFAILFAADTVGTWPIIALLACAALLRVFVGASGRGVGVMVVAQACAVGVIAGLGVFDADLAARLYPVAVSSAFLLIFAGSLFSGVPVIEQIARLTEPNLPPAGVSYCRTVTKVWCAFFFLNGGIALFTAVAADRTIWAIYNGFVSYVLMGCLFAVEYAFRSRMRKQGEAG
ncbi:MAG: hypothetical protein ACPGVA_03875 [Pikeienuella sp.]